MGLRFGRIIVIALLSGFLGLAAGCRSGVSPPPGPAPAPQTAPVDADGVKAIDETGDLLAASDREVFSVNAGSGHAQPVLQTTEPISSVSYTSGHAVITVFDPNDPKGFRGFYQRDREADGFMQVPTPQMAPKFSYINGDLLFLAAADRTAQKDGEYTRVGIYQLKERRWVKDWLVPGGVEDIAGAGKEVWFVTSNTAAVSSNLYKTDLATGEWGKLIQDPRRYPLDQVEAGPGGEVFMMISQRVKTEWSNKIYRWNPQQTPYELTSNFVSNTKPYSFAFRALGGKILIARKDLSGNSELDKPLSLLDLGSLKQAHLAWDHRPVALDCTSGEFVVLAEDGTLAFIRPEAGEKPDREFAVPELQEGKWIAAKKINDERT
ncbi:hypothetical protein LJK88_33425 [Paenibacillus sp. P26]|nr:hypothetical protein LJK88_33425 [Paenibacillus sp. P26]